MYQALFSPPPHDPGNEANSLPTTTDFASCEVANEGCVDVSGRRLRVRRLRKALRSVSKQVAALGKLKEAQPGITCTYLTSSLAICFFVLEDGSPSAEICFALSRRIMNLNEAVALVHLYHF